MWWRRIKIHEGAYRLRPEGRHESLDATGGDRTLIRAPDEEEVLPLALNVETGERMLHWFV